MAKQKAQTAQAEAYVKAQAIAAAKAQEEPEAQVMQTEAQAAAVEAAVEAESVVSVETLDGAESLRVTSVGYGKTEAHKNAQAEGSVWAELEGRVGYLPLVGSGERLYIDFSARDVGLSLEEFVQMLAQKQTELLHTENPGEIARADNGRLRFANENASLKAVLESVAQKAIAAHLGLALTERKATGKVGVSYAVE